MSLSPVRRHVPRCTSCGGAGPLQKHDREALCLRCITPIGEAPVRSRSSPGCLGCGNPLTSASLAAPFCESCLRLLGEEPAEQPERRRPCDHCGNADLTLYGVEGLALCHRCHEESSAVFSHHNIGVQGNAESTTCTFCRRAQDSCEISIPGPSVFICSSCVDLASWQESIGQAEPCPPRVRCSFSGSLAGEKTAMYSGLSPSTWMCDECMDLARELVLEKRTATRSMMRIEGPGVCTVCAYPTECLIRIASGAFICPDCAGVTSQTPIIHGNACSDCGASEDVAGLLLGTESAPLCRRCHSRRAERAGA